VLAENETVEGVDHRKSRENRCGTDEIDGLRVMAAAKSEDVL